MYIPHYYKNTNTEEVHDFIRDNGFWILVSQTESKLWATHISLVLEKVENEKFVLYGHISRGNRETLPDKSEVMVIFQGPHTYISSSWYDHENVPTWKLYCRSCLWHN